MDDGVDDRFPHGRPRHREGLDAIDAVVGNQPPRVLGVEQVDEESMWRRMEQQRGGPLQKGTVAKPESLDHILVGVVQPFSSIKRVSAAPSSTCFVLPLR